MDVVGMEASGHGVMFAVVRAKQMARIQMDRHTVPAAGDYGLQKGWDGVDFPVYTPASSTKCLWVRS